jgi:hypothetical protein
VAVATFQSQICAPGSFFFVPTIGALRGEIRGVATDYILVPKRSSRVSLALATDNGRWVYAHVNRLISYVPYDIAIPYSPVPRRPVLPLVVDIGRAVEMWKRSRPSSPASLASE